MADHVEKLTIEGSVADIWAVLADFESISRWAPNVDHSSLTTDTKCGIGATRRIQAGRTTVLETIMDWEPHRQLGYTITGLPPVIRSVTNSWRLDDLGGRVEVTLTSAVDAGPRPPQQLVARVVSRVLANASSQMLAGLDRHVQSHQHPGETP